MTETATDFSEKSSEKSLGKKSVLGILFFIFLLASFFRLYLLDSIPPGLYPDVAINGNDAIETAKNGEFRLFYPENNGREGLFIWLIAFSFMGLGISVWAIKIVAAILGILTIPGFYLLTRELFDKNREKIALLGTFFLAVSFWHVNFSRIGFRAVMVPLVLVFSFYFLIKGFKTEKWLYMVPAGFFFGLGFYTYTVFRLAVILLFLAMLGWFIIYRQKRSVKKFLKLSCALLLAIFFTALPIGLYFLDNPEDFLGRASQTSVLSASNPILEFVKSTALHLGMFNIYGDGNWRHNYPSQPELLLPVGLVFLIGLVKTFQIIFRALAQKKFGPKENSALLVIGWFLILLLPSALTREGIPHALRSIGAIPPAFILAGYGGIFLYQWIESRTRNLKIKKNLPILFLAVLALTASFEFYKYFIAWGTHPAVRAEFGQNLVDEADFLNCLPFDWQKIVVADQPGVPVPFPNGPAVPAQTLMFIEAAEKCQKTELAHCSLRWEYVLPEDLDKIKIKQKAIILPIKYDSDTLARLENIFPQGRIKQTNNIHYYEIIQ